MKNLTNKMVMFASVASMLFGTLTGVNAQDTEHQKKLEFGVRLMPTFSSLKMKTSSGGVVQANSKIGFGAGVFLGFNFSNHVGIQAEAIYSSISQTSNDNGVERQIKLQYVNIPLMLSLNTGKSKAVNLNAVVGPQLGINVGSKVTQSGFDPDNSQPILTVKKSDIGFAYGAGLDFAMNESRTARFGLGYRGVVGLVDISENSGTKETNSYYVIEKTNIRTNAFYVGVSIMF